MLEQEIAKLAKAIREVVTKSKMEGRIQMLRHVRIRKRDFTLKYQPDFGFANFPAQRIEEDTWDWNDLARFVESTVRDLGEYKSLVSALEKAATDTAHSVDRFSSAMAFASFQGLTDGQLSEKIEAFARDLDGLPMRVVVTAFMDGLSISESPIVVSDHLTLRQPVPEDVAEYVMLDEYGGFSFNKSETWFRVVGEFVCDAVSTGIAQNEFVRVVDALRLFRLGGVTANRYTMTAKQSFRHPGTVTLIAPGGQSRQFYTLSSSDVDALNKFLHDVAPLLPRTTHSAVPMTAKEIAYTRYNEALFQDGLSERIITSAATVLEALFLQQEPELGHRLAQRVSMFLRVLGSQTDARSTYDQVKEGYGIRSTFIHGGSVKPKDRPKVDTLAPILLNYARACVLGFFQMATPKAELLKQLDRAMIDPAGVPELVHSLASVFYK